MPDDVFHRSAAVVGTPSLILLQITSRLNLPTIVKENLTFPELFSVLKEIVTGKQPLTISTRPTTPSSQASPWERLMVSSAEYRALTRALPMLGVEKDGEEMREEEVVQNLHSEMFQILQYVQLELLIDLTTSSAAQQFWTDVVLPFTSLRLGHQSSPVPAELTLENLRRLQPPDRELPEWPLIYFSNHPHVIDNIDRLAVPVRQTVRAEAGRVGAGKGSEVVGLKEKNPWQDGRLHIAASFLDSSKPVGELKVVPSRNQDVDQQRQRALLVNAHKVIARQIGRSAFTYCVRSDISADWLVDPICVSGKFASAGTVSIDFSLFPSEILVWPETHNGVAAALQLGKWTSSPSELSSWLGVQRDRSLLRAAKLAAATSPPTDFAALAWARHAGLLFGSALAANNSLSASEQFSYLKNQNEILTSAVILGQSVVHRGTGNDETARLCLLHLPSVDVGDDNGSGGDVERGSFGGEVVVSAAFLGLGFVYLESSRVDVVKLLLKAMREDGVETESAALAAGSALGLVLLGNGAVVDSQTKLVDQLLDLIDSGNDGMGRNGDMGGKSRLGDVSAAASLVMDVGAGKGRSLTCAGACVGLGLAFLGSNDESVAGRVKIPNSPEELETEPRHDSLLFKFVCKSLVGWNAVEPTLPWLLGQLPGFLRDPRVVEYRERRVPGGESGSTVDWLGLLQARWYAIAGMAVVVGVKFAGTKDAGADKFLKQLLHTLVVATQWPGAHCAAQAASRPSLTMQIDRVTIETCRSALLLALAVVMAGSGDLDTFRYARLMRENADESTQAGVLQSVNMAIGFLFLGNGEFTVESKTKVGRASLLLSILPRYPAAVGDNKASLQLVRHLWALAVVPQVKEVDSRDGSENSCAEQTYVSVLSEPTEEQIRKLLDLPLGQVEQDQVIPLHWFKAVGEGRSGEGAGPAQLAALTWTSSFARDKLKSMAEDKSLLLEVEPDELTLCEKYAELLLTLPVESNRAQAVREMNECMRNNSLDRYLDKLEVTEPRAG